ncbi:MAG: hypothetical protein AAF439_14170 [Pseudomonadota bacterium]
MREILMSILRGLLWLLLPVALLAAGAGLVYVGVTYEMEVVAWIGGALMLPAVVIVVFRFLIASEGGDL